MKKQITLSIITIALIALATTCWCNHLDAKIAEAKARYEQDMQAVENLKKELAIIDAAIVYHERLADELAKENRKVHELNRQRDERIKAMETKAKKAKERE